MQLLNKFSKIVDWEEKQRGKGERLIRPSQNIEVFDFHEGTCPQASHLSSAQIGFFIIIAAQNNGSARWLMLPFVKLYFSYDSLNGFPLFFFCVAFSFVSLSRLACRCSFSVTSCGLMFLLHMKNHTYMPLFFYTSEKHPTSCKNPAFYF